MKLVDFIRQRLDEDEREARVCLGRGDSSHRWSRVLAQVAAMRAIVDRYEQLKHNRRDHPHDVASAAAVLTLHGVVKQLATIWSSHPDYDPAWSPWGE